MLTYILSKTFINVDVMGFKIGWLTWEQRKLGEIGETFSGLSGKNKNDFGHGDASFITYMNVFSNSIADLRGTEHVEIDSKQNQVIYGDILFTTSSETPEEVGMSSVWLGHTKNTYLNSFCFGYRILEKQNFDSYYMAYLLRTENFRKRMTVLAQGISRYNISKKQVMNTFVNFPTMEEQRKIGKALFLIDRTITLHEEKQRQLEQLKKALLQKMFADKKHPKPELRFKSFHDNWINHKAGDFMIKRNQKATIDDDFPLKAFIANKGVADKGERYDRSAITNDASNKMYKRTLFNDFIYSSNNLETGSIGLNKYGNASISPVYSIFYFKNKESADFFGRILVRKEFINSMIRYRQGVVYGQWRIKEKDFLNISISVPSLEEQEKIGSLLDKLDETINVNSKLLNQLKVLKKSLLQNMFI